MTRTTHHAIRRYNALKFVGGEAKEKSRVVCHGIGEEVP